MALTALASVLDTVMPLELRRYRASDVMSAPVVSVAPWERVDSIVAVCARPLLPCARV